MAKNLQMIWDQNYTAAFALIQKLYKPETTNRSALIKTILSNDKMVDQAQKVLQFELEKFDKKCNKVIDELIAFTSIPVANHF